MKTVPPDNSREAPTHYDFQPDPAGLERCLARVWRAKREWESVVDCLGQMLLLVDEQGKILRCNQAFSCLVRLPYEEIKGRGWEELLCGRGGMVREEGLDEVREYRHHASGRVFCCRLHNIITDYPPLRGTVVAFSDVSEQQRVAQELQRRNHQLTTAYDELKASQAKLLQQEKLASIGQLAAGVAHEINNPVGFVTSNLGSMVKYLERMRECIATQQRLLEDAKAGGAETARNLRRDLKIDYIIADAADLLRESLDGVERVKNIVRNLKRFSRVDQATRSRADINQCLDDTLNIVWNELKYKAEVVKDYGELPLTWCYPQQLNQVFMNLLLNAAQAIEQHGEIRISTRRVADNIEVVIADNGCGIAPEHLGRLFDPFFTTKEVGKGTGLGLSIVYDIVVKQHHGEITAASEPGRGASFRVLLPVVEKDQPDEQS